MANKVLDILRGMYVSAPAPVQKIIAPFIASLPVGIKFGSTYRTYRAAIKKSENDSGFVKEYVSQRLGELLKRSFNKAEYYRNLGIHKAIDMSRVESHGLDILASFPILKKEVLRENVEDLLTVPKGLLDKVSTSGSSGMPMSFYLDKDRGAKEWAFYHHIWSKAGYRPNDKRAVLRGVHMANADKHPWEYDLALRELRLSPFHLTKNNIEYFIHEISRHRVEYLHGYPSALSLIADHISREKWNDASLIKGIFPISESLYLHQRRELHRVFPNAKILPFYGLSEKVAFAGEIDGENGTYEFEPVYGITELVNDNGDLITIPGEKGRIVSTGLLNFGMPLIRYETGDVAELVQMPQESNAFRLRVKNIQSRWSQEFIVGANGELISIAAVNIHSAAYDSIREFQLLQDKQGYVEVRVVPSKGAKKENLEGFVKEIQDKVGSSIKFSLKQVESIDRNTRGKAKYIVQNLDLDTIKKQSIREHTNNNIA